MLSGENLCLRILGRFACGALRTEYSLGIPYHPTETPHTSVTRINQVVPMVTTSRLIFWHVTRVVQWEFINV